MGPLAWSIVLLFLGLALMTLEVFVPSGGVLGVLSIGSLLAAIILAFFYRVDVGFAFVLATAVAMPGVLVLAFKWWPHTPMGKRLLLDLPRSDEVLPDSPLRRTLRQLVGKEGVAKSVMLPSGPVLIEGMTVDASSEGMPIEAGQRVRVVAVHGSQVVVRPADDEPPPEKIDDVLSRPIESLGLEGLEDPLT